MDQQPLIADEFEKVRREDLGLLRFVGLLSGEILDADDPSHIACHLDHQVGEFELHREGVVENQHPGIADGGPPRTNRPARVNAGDIFLMGPKLVHLGDVETLKSIVECLVGFRDGFDTLLQHTAPLSQRSRIILESPRTGEQRNWLGLSPVEICRLPVDDPYAGQNEPDADNFNQSDGFSQDQGR